MRQLFLQTFFLNGVIFLGSMLAVRIVAPLLYGLLRFGVPGPQFGGTSREPQTFLGSAVALAHFLAYELLWLYPIYVISFVLNLKWYSEMAELSFELTYGPRKSAPSSVQRWLQMAAELIFRAFMMVAFLIQGMTAHYLLPKLGPAVSAAIFCWAYAFYSFEYMWGYRQWDLTRQIRYIERHWAYFAGFGTPCTLATIVFPSFVRDGIYALMMPLLILQATAAKPVPQERGSPLERLPIFSSSMWLADTIVRLAVGSNRRVGGRPASSGATPVKADSVGDTD